ncbi:N-myc-interactor [Mantella aurantiaca]
MDTIQKLIEDLEQLKKKYEQTTKQKTAKNLEKVKMEDKQEELERELNSLRVKKKKVTEALKEQKTRFDEELLEQKMKNSDLMEEETDIEQKLKEREKAFRTIQDNLMVNTQLPQKNINFKGTLTSAENQSDDESMDITYACRIISGRPYALTGGQALLTFEDEQVAKSVIGKRKHVMEIDGTKVTAEALEPQLHKSVKFEVNMNISSNKLKILSLPKNIPEDILKDKVELAFYKPSIGGAEIKAVDYDKKDNTAQVTYVKTGVAQRVLKRDRHQFLAGGAACEVEVMPCVDIQLNKLQMFSAISLRTVLLTGMKNIDDEDEDNVQDLIEIHFQKESNGGGEVETTIFSKDRKIPVFEEDLK